MSAGRLVVVDQRVRFPVAAAVLASTFFIGAIAGATIPSALISGGHAGTAATSHAVTTVGGNDMTAAAYAALHRASIVTTVGGNDMTAAAYAALHQYGTTTSSR